MATSYPSQPSPVDGSYTRLSVEQQNAHAVKIEMCSGSQVLYSVPTLGVPIFAIKFDLYDLTQNKMTGVSVTYSPDNPGYGMTTIGKDGNIVRDRDGTVIGKEGSIEYHNVPPSPPGYSAIEVRLRFTAPGGPSAGWLDLDIDYTYPDNTNPSTFHFDPGLFAWQPTLLYPRIAVANYETAAGDTQNFRDYSLLVPYGDLGQMGGVGSFSQGMDVQYAALYKTEEAQPKPYAQGFAMMGTDVRGHDKSVVFNRQGEQGELAFLLISPIFLKNRRYVEPVTPDAIPRRSFWLTKEDGKGYGFGGAYTHYMLRTFRVESVAAGVPADWMDVANLYRDWIFDPASGRKQYFIDKKFARPQNAGGPIDNLSPFTIISNYGLDGPMTNEDPKVNPAWLEIHPMTPPVAGAQPDVPGNKNESMYDALTRIRSKVGNAAVRLEAQIWGFERGGFYHYYGSDPPITNALDANPNSQRFQTVMQKLREASVFPSITTDPLRPQLNRFRFAGHIRWKGTDPKQCNNPDNWEDSLRFSFPEKFKQNTCALTEVTTKAGNVPLKRLFNVYPDDSYNEQPDCRDVKELFGFLPPKKSSQKFHEFGPSFGGGPLSNPFYAQMMAELCATADVENRYRAEWLPKVFGYGAKLIEFMKADGGFVCYNKEHQHILPQLTDPNSPYDNVIGRGPFTVKRFQAMCSAAYSVGRAIDPDFALTKEGAPVEPLLPYVEECYFSTPLFQYVYSEVISAKMSLGDYPPYIPPGYKEQRIVPPPNDASGIARPDYMLHPARDEEEHPDLQRWRAECKEYFRLNFKIVDYGLAPRLYPTGSETVISPSPTPNLSDLHAPANPLDETNPPTYTYCRCIQDVFNLRARIFNVAAKAVVGERILLSGYIFEKTSGYDQPYNYYDYNEELVNVMTRAVNMQTRHALTLRGGRMVGKTKVKLLALPPLVSAPKSHVFAWAAYFRAFGDVYPFAAKLNSTGITDFLSLAYDKDLPVLVGYERLQHMIWQKVFDPTKNDIRYSYVFANIGNSPLAFQFNYTHGFDSTGRWGKVIRVFDGSKGGAKDTLGYEPGYDGTERITEVHKGDLETIFDAAHFPLAARSFAVVSLRLF